MMNFPQLATILFILTSFATVFLLPGTWINDSDPKIRKRSLSILLAVLIWLVVQALVTINGFYYYTIQTSLPPKIMVFGVAPMLVLILLLFITPGGRHFIDSLSLRRLTWLHTIRVPVEIVLYLLFLQKGVPELMTFQGRNFDIVAGLTAPVLAYFGFVRDRPRRNLLLTWNFISLALLLNIVINALLSAPGPLQKFAFNQPNIAVLLFPYSWLPTFVVPVVLFSHLAAIRQLTRPGKHAVPLP